MLRIINKNDLKEKVDSFTFNKINTILEGCEKEDIGYIIKEKITSRGNFINLYTYDKSLYRYTLVESFNTFK